MVPNGSNRLQMAPNDSKLLHLAPNYYTWLQTASNVSKQLQKAPNSSKLLHIFPNSSNLVKKNSAKGSKWVEFGSKLVQNCPNRSNTDKYKDQVGHVFYLWSFLDFYCMPKSAKMFRKVPNSSKKSKKKSLKIQPFARKCGEKVPEGAKKCPKVVKHRGEKCQKMKKFNKVAKSA